MILADKIIDLRKKAGWSQEELADKLGVSRQSVSKWEGAQSVPDMNKILQRWHEAGLHTAAEVRQGDRKKTVPKGASGELGQAELDAIARIMQEG